MTLAVVEDIIGVAGDIDLCNDITRIGVEHDKPGGKAAADKQSMIRFVKRHREISKGEVCFPSCNDFALVAIDHRHVPRIGNIDENPVSAVFPRRKLRDVPESLIEPSCFPSGALTTAIPPLPNPI